VHRVEGKPEDGEKNNADDDDGGGGHDEPLLPVTSVEVSDRKMA
jgi:hypothetical protein